MNIKLYGTKENMIDDRVSDPCYIAKLMIANKNEIIDKYLEPSVVYDSDSKMILYPEPIEIGANLYLEILNIYEYGIVYRITSCANEAIDSADLVVGNNTASLFINNLNDDSSKSEKQKIEEIKNRFVQILGKKISIQKMYGKSSANKIKNFLDNMQRDIEKQIIELAINNSINTLNNSLDSDNKKILHKTRF